MPIQLGSNSAHMKSLDCWVKAGWVRSSEARDTKLKREVAIKILPNEFSRELQGYVRSRP